MASVDTCGRWVHAVVVFFVGALNTLFLAARILLIWRKLLFQSRLGARVPIGADRLSSRHDSSAGATSLASGAGSYWFRLVRAVNEIDDPRWGQLIGGAP